MGCFGQYEVGVYAAGEQAWLMDNGRKQTDNLRRVVIGRGGHNSRGVDAGPSSFTFYGEPVRAMIEKGYTFYGIDAGGGTTWGNPTSVARIADAIAHIKALFGVAKVALYGGSMGGLVVMNALKAMPNDICGVVSLSPALDLDWFHGTAGYAPTYAHAGATSFGMSTAEMETSFGTDAAGWAAATAGSRIIDSYAAFQGLGVPCLFFQGDADTTVPIGQAQQFIAQVNDPKYTLRTLVGSGHVPPLPAFGGAPMKEYIDFLNSLAW